MPTPQEVVSWFWNQLQPIVSQMGQGVQAIGTAQAAATGRPFQGPNGITYPTVQANLPSNIPAMTPLGGSGLLAPVQVNSMYPELYNNPVVQRHEIGHTVNNPLTPTDVANAPDWARNWARDTYFPIGEPANLGITSFGQTLDLQRPTPQEAVPPSEMSAQLYALGFGNPTSRGVGGPSEDVYSPSSQVPSSHVPTWLQPAVQQIDQYIAPAQAPQQLQAPQTPQTQTPSAPTPVAEWGEQQTDGSVTVYQQMDNGAIVPVRNEPWWQNQGLGAPDYGSGGQLG